MKRIYNSGTSEQADIFVGNEIEHTPAYGKRTLFVVGAGYDPDMLAQKAEMAKCEHIYFGANMSFNLQQHEAGEQWAELLDDFAARHFWFTLDFQPHQWNWVRQQTFAHTDQFIPMVSVRIPHIQDLNYNACIKLDDNDFQSTNPGVWVHRVHNLKDTSLFTPWSEYANDSIVS